MKPLHLFTLAAGLLLTSCAGEKRLHSNAYLEKIQKRYHQNDLSQVQVYVNQESAEDQTADYIPTVMNNMFQAGLFWDKSYPVRPDNDKYLLPVPWKKEDLKVRPFLEKYGSDQYSFYYRQECAQRMLSRTDLLKDKSKEALNILAFYTNIMLEEHTYSPGLMLCSLEKLRKIWPKEKVGLAIAQIVREHPKYEKLNEKFLSDFSKIENRMGNNMSAIYTEIMKQNDQYVRRLQKI
jgi:hypothetical protein